MCNILVQDNDAFRICFQHLGHHVIKVGVPLERLLHAQVPRRIGGDFWPVSTFEVGILLAVQGRNPFRGAGLVKLVKLVGREQDQFFRVVFSSLGIFQLGGTPRNEVVDDTAGDP